MKKLFFSLFSLLTLGQLSSQSYFTAMGIRMGSDIGVSLQQKLIRNLTMEGTIQSSASKGVNTVSLLLESHQPLLSKRFNFYIGAGLHHRWYSSVRDLRRTLHGVTAIAGAEMTLGRLNISWDYRPSFHINTADSPFESSTGVSLRYVFVKKLSSEKEGFLKPSAKKQREIQKKKRARAKERAQKNDKLAAPGDRSLKNIFRKKSIGN